MDGGETFCVSLFADDTNVFTIGKDVRQFIAIMNNEFTKNVELLQTVIKCQKTSLLLHDKFHLLFYLHNIVLFSYFYTILFIILSA